MKVVDLSVIIPTLNEQHYIGQLLDSLAKQSVQPKEVIIVDAQSKDATKDEVRKREKLFTSLSFYSIPKDTISKQRNLGVSKSTGTHLLFLDADMLLLERTTLKKLWAKIRLKKPDASICYVMPLSDELKDKVLYGTSNILATVMRPIRPMGTTMNLYVKRDVFDALHGFDEKVRVAEDFEFLSRVGKDGYSFQVFMRPIFYTSIRRLKYEGRKKFIVKLFKSMLHITTKGHVKNPIKYDFGKFTKKI